MPDIWRAGSSSEGSFDSGESGNSAQFAPSQRGWAQISPAWIEAARVVTLHRSGAGVDFVPIAGKARIGAHLDADPEPVLQRIHEIAGVVI